MAGEIISIGNEERVLRSWTTTRNEAQIVKDAFLHHTEHREKHKSRPNAQNQLLSLHHS